MLVLRNGLKWRDGRPRWEPSPASRALGLKGLDLKRPDGTWMDRGEAIGAADARALWAAMLRAAAAGGIPGAEALADLRRVLDRLTAPADPTAAARRALIGDLLAAARTRLGEAVQAGDRIPARRERTVARMVEAYFASDDVSIAPATRNAYGTHGRRLVARHGEARVAEVTRGQLVAWYRELTAGGLGLANANQCMGATAAFFAWAARQDPPWLGASPARELGLKAAPGRRVFWSMEAERAFVGWADANGYADIADGIVAGLWTGARIGDICAANLSHLAGEVWRFTPAKTAKRGQEAMPAIMEPLRARIARRRGQLVAAIDGAFLFDPRSGRRYDANTFGHRFGLARATFAAQEGAPEGFSGLRVQDTRDTCITRLWESGVAPSRMWPWTGHSQRSIEAILREHYIVLREQGALAMAGQLATWARAQGVAL
ncbi:MAG TPA: hypothetical protein VFC47_11445 [Caulobacteraceae bacterium]|nr:hypothetical protein [Caulobacteraceae bacterium]